MGPLFVGQVPAHPALFTITDEYEQAVDLSGYDAAKLLLTDPNGVVVDLSAGISNIVDAAAGQVSFAWPDASVFITPGDYRYQVLLTSNDGAHDLTTIGEIKVRRPLKES